MRRPFDHPQDPGRWALLETTPVATLWRREREDPVPVTLFYVVSPPRQTEVLYSEALARKRFETLNESSAEMV